MNSQSWLHLGLGALLGAGAIVGVIYVTLSQIGLL